MFSCENNFIKKTLVQAVKKDADLRGSKLAYADLRYAKLRYADLGDADLRGAKLKYADLRDSDLEGANLEGADLRYADFKGANLRDANLEDCDLEGVDLRDAKLRGAKLRNTGLIAIRGLGSRGRLTIFDTVNSKVICGCWYGGFDEFEKRVNDVYGSIEEYKNQYLGALSFVKSIELDLK